MCEYIQGVHRGAVHYTRCLSRYAEVERSCTKGDVWGRCGGANFEGSHSSETQLGNLDREQRRGKSIVIIFTYELFGMFATSKCDPSQETLW